MTADNRRLSSAIQRQDSGESVVVGRIKERSDAAPAPYLLVRCRVTFLIHKVVVLTLARKRSSSIDVDGIDYRWAISARASSSSDQVLLVVQSVGNGQRIVVTVPHHDRYLNMTDSPPPSFNCNAVTPSLLRTNHGICYRCRLDARSTRLRVKIRPSASLLQSAINLNSWCDVAPFGASISIYSGLRAHARSYAMPSLRDCGVASIGFDRWCQAIA
jgi:hypothetical protein